MNDVDYASNQEIADRHRSQKMENKVGLLDHIVTGPDFTFASNETVFSVLVSTDWHSPLFNLYYHVRLLFDRVRNYILSMFVLEDIQYFCWKGMVSVDSSGNLVLSEMYPVL